MPESRIESASDTPEPVDRVHQEQAVALLDDGGDQRLRQADVLGGDSLGDADDGRRELARGPRLQQHEPAVRLEGLEDLVHQEPEQLVDGDVAQQLDRQLVDDAQRLDQLAELLGREARIRLGRVRAQQLGRGLEDRVVERILAAALDADARRRLGLDLERHAADRDPVSGLQHLHRRQPLAVQERAVAGAEVLDREAAVVRPDDARVLAGEHLVGDRQIVHGRAADGGHRPVERDLARGHAWSGDVEIKHASLRVRDSNPHARGPCGGRRNAAGRPRTGGLRRGPGMRRIRRPMKATIHPELHEVLVHCACGETWTTRSTKKELRIEICSKCHPFFTGKQKLVDSAGRVERFRQRYEKKKTAGSPAS